MGLTFLLRRTMAETVNIPWILLKGALDQGSPGIQHLRAYIVLSVLGGHSVSRDDLRDVYKSLGINRSQFSREMKLLTKAWTPVPGYRTYLAAMYTDADGYTPYTRERAGTQLLDDLGVRDMGRVEVPISELTSIVTLRRFLYKAVAFTHNVDPLGGVTISRIGLRKLTGV